MSQKSLKLYILSLKDPDTISRVILFHFENYTAYFSHQYIKLSRIKEQICLQSLKFI